jgi:hypothetical protein
MTNRLPPSVIENIWNDAQRVSVSAMKAEQAHVDQTIDALINNHIGSGVLPSSLTQNILFDSDILSIDQEALLAANIFDGTGIQVSQQPSDVNLGNQIEIELSDSEVGGRKSIKVALVGVAFDDTIQCDRFYFYKNESQVTSKHYKEILAVFFNDFKGNSNCSANYGGRILIKEAKSFQISRDALMVAQDVEPDLFWRDFKKPNNLNTLAQIIQSGIGSEFSVDGLNISTTGRENKRLEANDVSSQVGQKFKATTDNIQKVTLLLAVDQLTDVDANHVFDWAGDLVISIYPLQTSVSCISDIVPNLAIDFDPAVVPVAQTSFNMTTLKDAGYFLNNILQPVDFVFSNTQIGAPDGITVGNYYILTIRRSGSANQNAIQIGVGANRLDDSIESVFGSSVWVDVPDEDLWFQIWTDAIKIADGAGYDSGNGIYFPKTIVDQSTGGTIDNQKNGYSLSDTGQNVLNIGIVQATVDQSIIIADERNGNHLVSMQQYVPTLSLISETDLEDLQSVSDPLIVGGVKDTNSKDNPNLDKTQSMPGLVNGDQFCVVSPDADLLSLNLIGSKLIPNTDKAAAYKISKIIKCMNLYGNPSGTGEVNSTDIDFITSLIGESLFSDDTTQKIYDGYFTTIQLLQSDVDGDGYITDDDATLVTQYVNREIATFPVGASFTSLCMTVEELFGRYDNYYCRTADGYLDGYGIVIGDFDSLPIYDIEADGYLLTPNINSDTAFSNIPFQNINYRIEFEPFWQPYNLVVSSDAKLVAASFSVTNKIIHENCEDTTSLCENVLETSVEVDPGRNDYLIPGNLVLGSDGQIINPDGTYFKHDLEVNTIELILPDEVLSNVNIDIVNTFIAEQANGKTSKGFNAMKYADCSFVSQGDYALNRIRLSVAIQSIDKQLDGYDDFGYSITVNDLIGVAIDHTTGILTLDMSDLAEDTIYASLSTKIVITVYLKKAAFNNTPLTVTSDQVLSLVNS